MWSSPQEANRHIETGGFTSERILLFISNLSLLTNVEEGRIGRVTLLEIWFIVEGIDDDVFEGKVEECNSEYESIEKGINIEDGVHDNFLTVEPWEYKVSIVPNKSAEFLFRIQKLISPNSDPAARIHDEQSSPTGGPKSRAVTDVPEKGRKEYKQAHSTVKIVKREREKMRETESKRDNVKIRDTQINGLTDGLTNWQAGRLAERHIDRPADRQKDRQTDTR